jgi:2-amino-4-hydroxy-6-hydroxymethyldihydropteridine diphosphokinase
MEASRIFLGLGSNLGDRAANLREASRELSDRGLRTVATSAIYETEPVGYKEQPWFLNQVIEVEELIAGRSAEELLLMLHEVEANLGRVRPSASGPRSIDIDLLLYGNLVQGWRGIRASPGNKLLIPHPRMHERRFVLEPLCEIAPELIHPVLGQKCSSLLHELEDQHAVRVYRQT